MSWPSSGAGRASGPHGNVTLSVVKECDVVIEVVYERPGLGRGPAGTASLGLSRGETHDRGGSRDVLTIERTTCPRLTFPAGLAPCGEPIALHPHEVPVD
jgi:hypothetical protein